jgi:prevent-host-death family protein
MTTSSQNIGMKQVRIDGLKARLSEYLRAVRGGESIAVLYRDTPIAQLIPVRERSALRVRKPARGAPPRNPALGPSGGDNSGAQPGMKVK